MSRSFGTGIVLIVMAFGALVISGCSKDHDPVAYKNAIDTGESSVPPVPYDLITRVGDQIVVLTWQVSDTTDIRWYLIARRDSLAGEFTVIDSVTGREYQDQHLKNGRVYRYCVRSVNRAGFVGSCSPEATAVPNGFSISINGGKAYVNDPSVTLTISAPDGANSILLADDSLFSGIYWEPYVAQKSWTLPPGDGTKAIFLKVRDRDDNETARIYRDDIILDTQASIADLTFTPQDSVLSPGDQIHFAMDCGELLGQARLDIGTVARDKKMYDDGTHGDPTAGDGRYEVDFIIPSGLQVIDAVVKGRFTDEAGNSAEEIASVNTLTIQQVPQCVELLPPSTLEGQQTALHLAWSRNQDSDFAAYRLYRSLSPGVQSDPDRRLIADIANQTTTSHDDTDLEENTTYYYQLSIYDVYGLCSLSNEVSGTTGQNEEPQPVTLLITSVELMPDDSTAAQIELKWTRSQEADFDHYLVYRDSQSGVSTSSIPIDLINDREATTLIDSQLQLSTRYYYCVYICDEGERCAGSNEVNATTPTGP